MPKELPIPSDAFTASKSHEFVRGWIINGLVFCSLRVGVWGKREPAFWGRFLSDVAHHMADALHEEQGLNKQRTVLNIRDAFNKALEAPSEEFSGDFVSFT